MMEKYNVAIIGCGFRSKAHLATLKKIDSVEVVAICDLDEEKVRETSKKWQINHYYTDFTKMLDNEDISILSIVTPPSSHSFLAVEAINRGIKNLVIEKPFTMTTKEADSIIRALEGGNVKMTIVYHWLFSKAMSKALSLIAEGEIGKVLSANMKVIHNPKLDPMASDPDHWCHTLLGGRFGEMLPHPVYVLQSILGDNLRVMNILASKQGNADWMPKDELHIMLQSDKGVGYLYVSFNAPRESINVEVHGTKAILKIDLIRQIIIKQGYMRTDKTSIGKDSLSEAIRMPLSIMKNFSEFAFRRRGDYTVENFYSSVIESLQKGLPMLVTPEMGYNTVRIVEEISKGI